MTVRCDKEFMPLMAGFDLAGFDADPSTICGFWPDGRLAYLNQGWFDFAVRNDGEPAISERFGCGASILATCPAPLDEFYRRLFESAAQSCDPIDHEYECSSSDIFRLYHMRIHRLDGGKGLLAIHSLRVERAHDPGERPAGAPHRPAYLNPDGFIKQCGNCRRFQRVEDRMQWDWVPAWVKTPPPAITHGLCHFCLEIYYSRWLDGMH